jgi:hypothetical protein
MAAVIDGAARADAQMFKQWTQPGVHQQFLPVSKAISKAVTI